MQDVQVYRLVQLKHGETQANLLFKFYICTKMNPYNKLQNKQYMFNYLYIADRITDNLICKKKKKLLKHE